MPGLDGNGSGDVPIRGGGGSAAARDEEAESSGPSEDVPSVSQQSWAPTDASCLRGDLRAEDAMATGEMNLRPEAGLKYPFQAFDGDFSQSANEHNDREPGISGTFGVLCGNWGGSRD